MAKPTNNDWLVFGNESENNKVEILYHYLCLGSGNMQEIGRALYGDYDGHEAQRVSVVTRCYGFEGQNKGKYRKWDVTKEDVVAFVRKYRNGCNYDDGATMEAFLRERIQKRKEAEAKKMASTRQQTAQSRDIANNRRQQVKTVSASENVRPKSSPIKENIVTTKSGFEDISDSGSSKLIDNIFLDAFFLVMGISGISWLIVRYMAGTIWDAWYQKILTIILGLFALAVVFEFINVKKIVKIFWLIILVMSFIGILGIYYYQKLWGKGIVLLLLSYVVALVEEAFVNKNE